MEVSLDGRVPYTASCKQRIAEIQIPQIQPGATMVAVRANPSDVTQIAVDFNDRASGRDDPGRHRQPLRGGDPGLG